MSSVSYRVLFYYSEANKESDYWDWEGQNWSKDVDQFASSSKLKTVAAGLVSASDTESQKASKEEENKAEGVKAQTAEDIWAQKRGDGRQITLLFIGLARAAGLKAYAMAVTRRDRELFWSSYLSMEQLPDYIAIVSIDGKEQYFDPGERYCAFGQLDWIHTTTGGLREALGGTVLAQTPGAGYTDSQTIRFAQLDLDASGKLEGVVRVKMSGAPALNWRQLALRTDEEGVKREFEKAMQRDLPQGVEVKTNHFVGLADGKDDLMVTLDVSGTMGTVTSRRILLPSSFFEAASKPLFVSDKREDPIDLHYPSLQQDTVSLDLPKDATVESVPSNVRVPLAKNAVFAAKYAVKADTYTCVRMLVLANSSYEATDYPGLKDFYARANAQDQQQIVLTLGAPAAGQ